MKPVLGSIWIEERRPFGGGAPVHSLRAGREVVYSSTDRQAVQRLATQMLRRALATSTHPLDIAAREAQ